VARGRRTAARVTPAERSRRFDPNAAGGVGRLNAPALDWSQGWPPQGVNFPEIRDLVNLSVAELNDLLSRFGILDSWPQARVSTAGYVQRMSQIPPGSQAFKDEINRLLDERSKRGALGLTRRAYSELSLVDALNDDPNTELIWIADGDERTCAPCAARGGDIGTIAYHSEKGLPGNAVCLGGAYCRCQLVPIG
jgi:hypothetical protein